MTTPQAPDGVPIGISPFPDPPAHSPEPQRASLFVDDMPDNPLGPGECIVWFEGEYVDLFDWAEFRTDDPDDPTPHFDDDLPDSATYSEQHEWLESNGFEADDSLSSYSHSITPCPVCESEGHALFGRWGVDSAAPSYFCQKLQKHLDWTPSAVALPAPESAGALPTEEEAATPPPEGPATWTAVTSIAELKALPRWIGVKNKKPLQYRPNSDPTKPLKGSTFSHRGKDDSKCGGFVDDISAQSFVRHGGVCLDHVSVSEQWDAKESRFRRMKRITPELQSMGWGTYAKWETLLEGKSGGYGISYCCTYDDAPKIIVVDIDFPKAKKGEELDPVVVEATDATRDAITQRLSALGCPTCPSASTKGRRAAFTVSDPAYYQSKHLIWRHPIGVNVELNPPGCARHVMLYTLDGDLPELDPVAVDALLTELNFKKNTRSDYDAHTIRGSKGLASFMEVCDREGWDLKFNTQSQTAFADGVEQDDGWIHRTRSHLELNYILAGAERTTPTGGAYVETTKFNANEKLVLRWGLEASLLRSSYHPVQDWLAKLPAWDGVDRIDTLLQVCLGASVSGDDDAFTLVRTASRDIIMGMTCRAMEPGCGWPRITCLWGEQGCGKSTFYEHLPPPEQDLYYESLHFPMTDEELFDNTRSKWLVEFSDPSTRRAESETAKGFISRKQYQIRHKYGLLSSKHAYSFHMGMSGNPGGNTNIPVDGSGYRRYLSVDCVKVTDYEGMTAFLNEHREQIFAEAMHRYHAGERFAELPAELHKARDAAAQMKAGNEALDNFFESVVAQVGFLQAGDRFPADGVSIHSLVTQFLTTINNSVEGGVFKEPDQGRVSEFINRNSVAISAGMKQLEFTQRKIGKAKLRRWFPGV